MTDSVSLRLLNQIKDKNVYRMWRRQIAKEILLSKLLPCSDCHSTHSFTLSWEQAWLGKCNVPCGWSCWLWAPVEQTEADGWAEVTAAMLAMTCPPRVGWATCLLVKCLLVTRSRPHGEGYWYGVGLSPGQKDPNSKNQDKAITGFLRKELQETD